MSGIVPIALLAPVTATHRVRSREQVGHALDGQPPGRRCRTSANRTVAPVSSATSSHGETLESWSSRVQMISSPGCEVAADRPGDREHVGGRRRAEHEAVGIGVSSSPIVAWTRSTSSSHASAAANAPWLLALLPLRCQAPSGLDRRVDDLRAGRAVEAGPRCVVAFGDGGESVAEIEHAVTLAQAVSQLHADQRPDVVGLGVAGGLDHERRRT